MISVRRLLSRVFGASEWQDIATAPFDRELELAVIDSDVGVLDVSSATATAGSTRRP